MEDPQMINEHFSEIGPLIQQRNFTEALLKIENLGSRGLIRDSTFEHGLLLYLRSLSLEGEEAETMRKEAHETFRKSIMLTPAEEETAKGELTRGIILFDLGEIDLAEARFGVALAIFMVLTNAKGEVDACNELARIYFLRSDYDQAIKYLKRCLSLSKETGYEKGEVNAVVNLGRIYMLKGELQAAAENFLAGIKIHQKMPNQVINLSKDLRSLAYVYYLQRKFEESKARLEESYAIIQGKGLTRDEAVHHEYMGALLSAQGDLSSAHKHFDRVFELAPEGDMASQTYRLKGELQIKEGIYDEAFSSCEKGRKIAEKIGERIEVGAIHRALGQIFAAKGEKEESKEHFEKSISLLKEIQARYELGLTYIEAGRLDAFDYYNRIVFLGNAKEIFGEIGVPHYVEESLKLQREISTEPPIIQREQLEGCVKKIIGDKAYIVFETPGGPLERAVKLSKLEAINADRRGASIKFVVEERGASTNIRFENLEEKGIPNWRDEIKDEDLGKFDLMQKFALPRKPSKLQ